MYMNAICIFWWMIGRSRSYCRKTGSRQVNEFTESPNWNMTRNSVPQWMNLKGFDLIMRHFQVPPRRWWRCRQGRIAPTAWGVLTGRMPTVATHLIPFTGADRYNYSFIIGDKHKCGTYQLRPGYAAFLGFITPMMAVSAGQNGTASSITWHCGHDIQTASYTRVKNRLDKHSMDRSTVSDKAVLSAGSDLPHTIYANHPISLLNWSVF